MLVTLTLLGVLAASPPSTVDELVASAQEAFERKDYDAVIDALRRAHALDPRAELVYGIAQAERLGGDCAAAIRGYRDYLALDPPRGPAQEARLGIAECEAVEDAIAQAQAAVAEGDIDGARARLVEVQAERRLVDIPQLVLARGDVERAGGRCEEARASYRALEALSPKQAVLDRAREHADDCPPGSRSADPVPAPRLPAGADPLPDEGPVDREQPPATARAWWRDPAGGVLFGVGLAATGTGLGLTLGALSMQRLAPDATNDERAFGRRLDRAATLHGVGLGVVAAGGALLIGSVIRYVVVARRNSRPSRRSSRR